MVVPMERMKNMDTLDASKGAMNVSNAAADTPCSHAKRSDKYLPQSPHLSEAVYVEIFCGKAKTLKKIACQTIPGHLS